MQPKTYGKQKPRRRLSNSRLLRRVSRKLSNIQEESSSRNNSMYKRNNNSSRSRSRTRSFRNNDEFVRQLEASEAARNKRTRNSEFVRQLEGSEAARNKRVSRVKNMEFVRQKEASESARNFGKSLKRKNNSRANNLISFTGAPPIKDRYKKKTKINDIRLALEIYLNKYGRYPSNWPEQMNSYSTSSYLKVKTQKDKNFLKIINDIRSGLSRTNLDKKYKK